MESQKEGKSQIRDCFFKMQYEQIGEQTNRALEWFTKKDNKFFAYVDNEGENPSGSYISITNCVENDCLLGTLYIPDVTVINDILKNCNDSKNKWNNLAPLLRSQLINSFIKEVNKQSDLICQIEIISRGILRRDTQQSVKHLADYLQYYRSFAYTYLIEKPSWKPKGLAVAILSEKTPVSLLGTFLGPTLAAGYNIILNAEPSIVPVVALLIDMSLEAGLPPGTIRLIPGSVDPQVFLNNSSVSVVTIFDDLFKEKYKIICNLHNKKLITLSSFKIPVIVFEDADLDSICQSVINATWGYNGECPWSVGEILVQESIFAPFIVKLKRQIQAVKMGSPNDRTVDIACPTDPSVKESYTRALKKAADTHVEVFKGNFNCFSPTLFIGDKIYTNNVIKETMGAPILTLTAFRNITEVVNLANNTRQGFAASVWTENGSLANEVAQKMKVSTVWINGINLMLPEVTISPCKSSGMNYFGGKEGFFEYVNIETTQKSIENTLESKSGGSDLNNAVIVAKKAFSAWGKLFKSERAMKLQNFADQIETFKENHKYTLPDEWFHSWIKTLYEAPSLITNSNDSIISSKYCLTSYNEPKGVLAIEVADETALHNKKLISGALLEGNVVILISSSPVTSAFYSNFSKSLPSGVLTVISQSKDVIRAAALNRELDVYFGDSTCEVMAMLPLKDARKFKTALDDWKDILMNVTFVKNVWSNVGQSFI